MTEGSLCVSGNVNASVASDGNRLRSVLLNGAQEADDLKGSERIKLGNECIVESAIEFAAEIPLSSSNDVHRAGLLVNSKRRRNIVGRARK